MKRLIRNLKILSLSATFLMAFHSNSFANSKSLFLSFENSQQEQNIDSDIYDSYSENSEINQTYLKRAFASFIRSLLKRDIELSKISFDRQTTSFLDDPTSFKAHIRVLPGDIIDPVNRYTSKTKMIWVKPYLRDVFFQTRSMVCKYSYRSKYRKPRKSLSGHFIHENHGSLICKDIENGTRARPFVFGNKKLIFIAELIPQKQTYSSSQITSFKVNESKRNKTFY